MKKTGALAAARLPQARTRGVAAGEIDLRRVLNRQNPPPRTGRERARRQRLDDPFRRDPPVTEKAVRSNLARARAAQPSQHHRSRRDYRFTYLLRPLRQPHIAKTPTTHLQILSAAPMSRQRIISRKKKESLV